MTVRGELAQSLSDTGVRIARSVSPGRRAFRASLALLA